MKRQHRAHEIDLRDAVSTDISPFHIAVGVLVHFYSVYVYQHDIGHPLRAANDIAAVEEYREGEEKLRKLLLRLVQSKDRVYQLTMEQLLHLIRVELGKTSIAQQLHMELIDFLDNMNNPDDLLAYGTQYFVLMSYRKEEPAQEGDNDCWLEPQTELGQFARELSLALRSLQFEALCLLFSKLQVYGRNFIKSKEPSFQTLHWTQTGPQRERRKALQAFIEYQNKLSDIQGPGRSKPNDLDQIIHDLEQAAPDLALIHRLRFHLAMEEEDHMTAVDALQRYFDYSHGPAAGKDPSSDQPKFANALLNLGATHVHFGDHKNAMLALNETVRVAQQIGNDTILQHALSQLCRLLSSYPAAAREGDETLDRHEQFSQLFRLLQRCYKCSMQQMLPHLTAYARLMLAQFRWQQYMKLPDSEASIDADPQPTGLEDVCEAVEHLQQIEYVSHITAVALPKQVQDPTAQADNEQPIMQPNDLYPSQTLLFSTDLEGREGAVAGAVGQLAGSSYLLRATACLLAGKRQMAETSIKIFLSTYASKAPVEDCCTAYAQLAFSAAESQGHEAGMKILELAGRRYASASCKQLSATRLCLQHQQAQHQGQYEKAEHFARQIIALAGPINHLNSSIRFEGQRRMIESMVSQERIEEAEVQARIVFEACQDAGMQGEAARILLTFCELHRFCNAPASALPYARACHKHALALSHTLLAAESQVHMANLSSELKLKSREECQDLLHEVMPLIVGNGSLELRAQLHWTIAMVLLRRRTRRDLLSASPRVLRHLKKAAEIYEVLENRVRLCECLYFMSILNETLGETQASRRASEQWMKHQGTTEFTRC